MKVKSQKEIATCLLNEANRIYRESGPQKSNMIFITNKK